MDEFNASWFPWRPCRYSTWLTFMVLCLLWFSETSHSGNVEKYIVNKFDNPNILSKFNHFTVNNRNGIVYVGAENALYSLATNLDQSHDEDIPCNDCEVCAECINYNKVLLIDYANENLITCGSENDGTCQTRSLEDITILKVDNNLVASVRNTSTEAIIVSDSLYVAATYNSERHLMADKRIPPISARTLGDDDPFTIESNRKVLFSQDTVSTNPFIINYIKSFFWNEFVYFISYQRMDFSGDPFDRNYVSKMSRVCVDGDSFESYTEIWIECQGKDGSVYNLIQAAHVGTAGPELADSFGITSDDRLLYAVFSKNTGRDGNVPSNSSALCIFKIEDVESKFIDAIHGCLSDGNDYGLGYVHGSTCPGLGTGVNRDIAVGQQCNALNYQYADTKTPLTSTAVVEWQDVVPASIITVTHRMHTIAFVGTALGNLLKVHVEAKTSAREYERVPVGSPVLKDTMVDAQQQHVMVLTQQQLLRLKVEDCGQYSSCIDCIGSSGGLDGDPYCGWCSLQNRCTRYQQCPQSEVSARWLPYNNSQCVNITNIQPFDSLPVTTSNKEVNRRDLTMNNGFGER
ncbi:plexin-A4-like [Amphiura filiformis]|uniref:plexin-A4-like n=1 Tax=Amphiura filiformis TaxID=82378 RepID=UPI003B20DFF1